MTLVKMFIGCSLFFFSISIMASSKCPPITNIRNVQIIKAEKIGNNWGVMSNDFKYNELDWNLLFVVNLPNASSSSQAISQTEAFLKKVDLHEPIPESVPVGGTICVYAKGNEGKYSMIMASNPPIHSSKNQY